MDFLKEFLTDEDYNYVISSITDLNKKYISDNYIRVKNVLDLLNEIGVNKMAGVFIYRVDLLLEEREELEKKFKDFDKDFIRFIIEEDIQNLIILGI